MKTFLMAAVVSLMSSPVAMAIGDAINSDLPSYFLVEDVQGTVFYRSSLGSVWREMATSDKLPVGSLVQTTPDSSLNYTYYRKRDNGWSGEQSYITIKLPMIFRMEPNMLRDATVTEFHFQRMPVIRDYHKKEKYEEYFPFLRNAWDRISIFMSREETQKSYIEDLFKKAKEPVEMGFRAKKIKLTRPQHGAAMVGIRYPMPYQVRWQRPEGYEGAFEVFLWQAEGAKTPPVATTEADRYDVLIPQADSYYIQVGTPDKKYLSKPHIIHFSVPKKELKKLKRGIAQKSKDGPLQLIYPDNNFNVFSDGRKTVDFFWDTKNYEDLNKLTLVIKNTKTRSEKRYDVDTYSVDRTLRLKFGSYQWWLEGIAKEKNEAGEAIIFQSVKRMLHIVSVNDKSNSQRLVNDFMNKKGVTRLYLDEVPTNLNFDVEKARKSGKKMRRKKVRKTQER